MKRLAFFVILFFSKVLSSEEEEDQEPPGNLRIIGGDPVKNVSLEAPFIVAYKMFWEINEYCTGVLITKRMVLTAATCFLPLLKSEVYDECIAKGSDWYVFRYKEKAIKIKCTNPLPPWGIAGYDEQYSIMPDTKSRGMVWISMKDGKEYKMLRMKKITIHPLWIGWTEKTYGEAETTDLALLELVTEYSIPESEMHSIGCLARPNFKDSNLFNRKVSIIAGFGNYTRRLDGNSDEIFDSPYYNSGAICQTNEYGRYKHHYCFSAKDGGYDPCKTNFEELERKLDGECKEFFKENKLGSDENEAMIVDTQGLEDKVHNCFPDYNPENKRYGWCTAQGEYYDFRNPNEDSAGGVDWGYCSKECNLKEGADRYMELRFKKDLTVIPKRDCMEFVYGYSEDEEFSEYVDFPDIYCVGEVKKWKVGVWKKVDGKYMKVTNMTQIRKHLNMYHYGVQHYAGMRLGRRMEYVVSPGACGADLGGPLYYKMDNEKNYLITGIASMENGKIGLCGGINHPMHYVKIRRFHRWIRYNMMKGEKYCISDGKDVQYFTKRRDARKH